MRRTDRSTRHGRGSKRSRSGRRRGGHCRSRRYSRPKRTEMTGRVSVQTRPSATRSIWLAIRCRDVRRERLTYCTRCVRAKQSVLSKRHFADFIRCIHVRRITLPYDHGHGEEGSGVSIPRGVIAPDRVDPGQPDRLDRRGSRPRGRGSLPIASIRGSPIGSIGRDRVREAADRSRSRRSGYARSPGGDRIAPARLAAANGIGSIGRDRVREAADRSRSRRSGAARSAGSERIT